MLPAPEPIRVILQPEQLPPNDVEMSLVDHLEELRQRVFRSLIAIVLGALACLLAVKPLVRLLEEPAGSIDPAGSSKSLTRGFTARRQANAPSTIAIRLRKTR